jgi:hypothetical protein
VRFSDCFRVKRVGRESWFDPVLSLDTPLFLDPFLVYAQEGGVFRGSHTSILAFFNNIFARIAGVGCDPTAMAYRKAVADLKFPEAEELCIGYTAAGTKGSGSGEGLARAIAAAVSDAIRAGVREVTHFERLGILGDGIGADRISDITATLLRDRLATYTLTVCERHKVKTKRWRYTRASYDLVKQRWAPGAFALPINPYNGKPILLVPRNYLRSLPTENADDFWDFCYDNFNEILRNEFNEDISRNVSKHEILRLARRHPELLVAFEEHLEQTGPEPYDLEKDEKLVVRWYDAARDYCRRRPLKLRALEADFDRAIDQMVAAYQHFVEENGGWRLLWNDNETHRSEKAVQLLFLGVVKHYCQANDIDVSPEANIGRGPVDFKLSRGAQLRRLLEVKLANNTKFWRGVGKQLPAYLRAEREVRGYFLVVVFSEDDGQRIRQIQRRVAQVNREQGTKIRAVVVDAQGKPSASKL